MTFSRRYENCIIYENKHVDGQNCKSICMTPRRTDDNIAWKKCKEQVGFYGGKRKSKNIAIKIIKRIKRRRQNESVYILRRKPNLYKGYMYPLYPNHVKLFRGKLYSKPKNHDPIHFSKVIVLDLDETIGSFQDLFILWRFIKKNERQERQEIHTILFDELLDLYPEFLRHGILSILEYLAYKKSIGECSKIFLYTNNQCSLDSEWIYLITRYLDKKLNLNQPLFDQLICSFKIENKRIEVKRTSHEKTYTDLIRCTLLPKSTEICFIDNSYYPKMKNDRVYYIQPKSYHHSLSQKEVIDRYIGFMESSPFFTSRSSKEIYDWFSTYHSHKNSHSGESDDFIVSQKIMYHLKEFFLLTTKKQKTRKVGIKLGRFTRKRKNSDGINSKLIIPLSPYS